MGYNAISLFSGAMGLDLGLEKAGIDTRVCVELDRHACQTIRKNTDIPVIERDVNRVTVGEMLNAAGLRKEEVFVVAGGPPCQAFSTAGRRKALSDFRGNVIIRFLEIVREIRPRYFILENVRGLLSTPLTFVPEEYNGTYKDIVKHKGSVAYFLYKQFQKLGYSVSFHLFNSANYGVPQIRERVLFFGHHGDRVPLPRPTHSESGKETGKKWVSFREAVKGLGDPMEHSGLSEKAKKYLSMLGPGQNWKDLPQEVQKEAMGASYHLGGGKTGFYRRLSWDRPSPTLVTSPAMPATMLAHPTELRPLSVQEYMRIQQFPDDWKLSGNMQQKYKQIGNAVPVGLGYIAGKAVINHNEGRSLEKNGKRIPFSRYRNCSDREFIPRFERLKELAARRKGEKIESRLVAPYQNR